MAGDKKDIPEWQRNSSQATSENDLDKSSTEEKSQPVKEKADDNTRSTKSREDLLEQARTFLAHEEIRDASTESKISFLEEKGLSNDEIQQLLGVSRNETSTTTGAQDDASSSQPHISSGEAAAAAPAPAADSNSPSPPPIITYPEFLVHASKPPPLVTPARALKAVYAATLLGTGVYGASRFVLQPMFESLSEARHELFTLAKSHLAPLNEKLEGLVSTVPPLPANQTPLNVGHERRRRKGAAAEDDEDEEDEEDGSSVASDPTEMFHRDMAVQTSPPSSPSLSGQSDEEVEKSTGPTDLAAKRLAGLREHLDSLLQTSNTVLESSDAAREAVRHTEVYLDQVRYGDGAGTGLSGMGDEAWRSQIFGAKVAGAGKKTDAVDDLKSDIRAMKGAMLSARNFPRGLK